MFKNYFIIILLLVICVLLYKLYNNNSTITTNNNTDNSKKIKNTVNDMEKVCSYIWKTSKQIIIKKWKNK